MTSTRIFFELTEMPEWSTSTAGRSAQNLLRRHALLDQASRAQQKEESTSKRCMIFRINYVTYIGKTD